MRVTEIADGIYQLTSHLGDVDLGLNVFVVSGDEPLLFHTGLRSLFADVVFGVASVLPPPSIRWISFGHVEADECGSVNEWLAAAPQATVVHGYTACMDSLGDLADREPKPLADGEVLDIGGHRLRWIDTPHTPHAWEAGLMYDETTKTLLCGDLFARWGRYPAIADDDPVEASMGEEDPSWSLSATSGDTLRRLADLDIDTLAPMHGPAYQGDCAAALTELARIIDHRSTERNSHVTSP